MGAVVGVERHGERAARAVADVLAARLLQLGHEVRIAARGGQVEPEQGLLAVMKLGDGGQHPGRHLGGPAAGRRVGEGGAQPPLGRPPGRDQPDDAAPDDEGVVAPVRPPRVVGVSDVVGRVTVRAWHAAPPFAGMTRIRFVRSEAVSASLSARYVRAPASARPATLVRAPNRRSAHDPTRSQRLCPPPSPAVGPTSRNTVIV